MENEMKSIRSGGDAVNVVFWILIAIFVVIAIGIGLQLPEIRRYLKVRSM